MSDAASQPEAKVDLEHLNALKVAHDKYATVAHLLSTRFQFYAEEFQGIQEMIAFFSQLRAQVKQQIELLEPSTPTEPKKPYVIDVAQNEAAPN